MENSVVDEALVDETDGTVCKSEEAAEAAAAESSVKCDSEDIATEIATHEVSVIEYKAEEDVTSESSECEMNGVECAVREEDSDVEKEAEDEHVMLGVDTTVKYDSKKDQGVSESRERLERSDSYAISDIRSVVSDVGVLHKCETRATAEINSVGSDVRNSVDQDLDLAQEMTVNDADHMTYEPNMVPQRDVIHESAVLDSTDCILKDNDVVQYNSNSKDGDAKTAVDVSAEVGSVLEHEDSKVEEDEDAEEVQAALIAAVAESEGCCWDVVDSTEKLLAEVPLVALEAVPMPVAVPVTLAVVEEGEAVEEVEVIPMQEELEVRLEEGTFPVTSEDALSMDWPYPMKMDSAIVAAALNDAGDGTSSTVKSTQAQYPEYSTSQAVKLELEG
jgi:hypothetical protein